LGWRVAGVVWVVGQDETMSHEPKSHDPDHETMNHETGAQGGGLKQVRVAGGRAWCGWWAEVDEGLLRLGCCAQIVNDASWMGCWAEGIWWGKRMQKVGACAGSSAQQACGG
jgi:hypothetical protein